MASCHIYFLTKLLKLPTDLYKSGKLFTSIQFVGAGGIEIAYLPI